MEDDCLNRVSAVLPASRTTGRRARRSERAVRFCLTLGLALLAGFLPAAGWGDALHRGVSGLTRASGISESPSRECGACHSAQFALWVGHPHSHFLIDPAKDPKLFEARWESDTPGWAQYGAGRFHRGDVALVYGLLQIQVLFREDSDGHRLLPAQWNLREGRWEALPKELDALRKANRTWEQECAGCHVTGLQPHAGSYTERNVGCAACHGDGTAHLASDGKDPILHPGKLSPGRRAEICGACHSRGHSMASERPYPTGFQPGKALAQSFTLIRPAAGQTTDHFWADGTERLPYMQYPGFIQSGHSREGLDCVTCHNPHGSDREHNLRRRTDELCTGCHDAVAQRCREHEVHPSGAAVCADCHMAITNPHSGQGLVHTHTFRVLQPGRTPTHGMPSSCTVECHAGRGPDWAASILEEWRREP